MKNRNHTLDFRYLKQRVSIRRVLAHYCLDRCLRRTGNSLTGPCPMHNGDNRTAFRVDLRRGIWHCWTACGGGDVVDLVMRIEHCSYPEAARHLAMFAGCSTLSSTPPDQPSLGSCPEHFQPFRRVLVLEPRVPFLQEVKRINIDTAVHFETGYPLYSNFLRGTVAVRLHDQQGQPIGYCGRRLDSMECERWGKWRFPRDLPKADILYNAHRARPLRNRGVVVTECAWSVMRLTQAGVPGTVALLGTSLSPAQMTWLSRAPTVLLLLDGDDPGRKAARAIEDKLRNVTTILIHDLPDGHDPDDLSDDELRQTTQHYLPSL